MLAYAGVCRVSRAPSMQHIGRQHQIYIYMYIYIQINDFFFCRSHWQSKKRLCRGGLRPRSRQVQILTQFTGTKVQILMGGSFCAAEGGGTALPARASPLSRCPYHRQGTPGRRTCRFVIPTLSHTLCTHLYPLFFFKSQSKWHPPVHSYALIFFL
jgi:hypothetical protein